MRKYKLYIWSDMLNDYTSGVIFAAASSRAEAECAVMAQGEDWERESLELAIRSKDPLVLDLPAAGHVWGGG